MKRYLLILLAALMLVGCAPKTEPDTAATQPTNPQSGNLNPTAPTSPAIEPDLYAPNSAIEQQTNGAVRAYTLEKDIWFGLSGVGNNVLLLGENAMKLLSGEQGTPTANAKVETLSATGEYDTYTTGVAYYVPASRKVTVLNTQLQPTVEMTLPENVAGTPVISLIRNEVYYFTGSEIRAMNLTTGISRLLRQQSNVEQLLPEDYFDGNVLSCRIKDSAGIVHTEYFSSETGQAYDQVQAAYAIQTVNDRYFISRADGNIRQMIFGQRNTEPQSFLAPVPENGGMQPVLEMNGAISYELSENGLTLNFYDLSTGKCIARTQLANVKAPLATYGDGVGIWLLTREGEKQILLRWDITKSAVAEETVYTGQFYTPQNPDTDGIQACQQIADTYFEQYGLKVNIWQNAVKVTGDHIVEAEHRPQAIRAALDQMQPVLAVFPNRAFLQKTVEAGWIQVSIVQSIDGGKAWTHFWQNSDCWILIASSADAGDAFAQAVAYAIDSHVLGNSRDFDFDRWNPLNPEGFTYANSYDVQPNPAYLEGDTRAFTDALAMSYIHEDRCRIFYHAMKADNAEMFASATMQAKLYRLCIGIREAYGLQKSESTFLWEQYLQTSLAYGK